jgi:multidrug efflux pump subunit AcrB
LQFFATDPNANTGTDGGRIERRYRHQASRDDLEVLRQKADQIAAVVSKVPGAADVRAERVAGLPYLRIRIRRDALAVMVLTPRTCLIPSRHHFHSLLLL